MYLMPCNAMYHNIKSYLYLDYILFSPLKGCAYLFGGPTYITIYSATIF